MLSKASVNPLKETAAEQGPRIIVLALEILKVGDDFLLYKQKTVKEKIDLLSDNIINGYQCAINAHPNAEWVIAVWREHGIADHPLNSISIADKQYLDMVMKQLTDHHKKLVIVSGGTLIRQTVPFAKLEEIHIAYQAIGAIKETEKYFDDQQVIAHENEVQELIDNKFFNSLIFNDHLIKYKNKAYVYYRNQKSGHGKLTPFNELESERTGLLPIIPDNKVFEPAKGRHLRPIVSIDKNLTIGVEICRENSFSIVKNAAGQEENPIHLQFVVSDSCRLLIDSIHACHGVIHVDSMHSVNFILPRQWANLDEVQVFSINAISKTSPQVLTPVMPTYPLQFSILDYLDQYLAKTSSHFLVTTIEALKEKIIDHFPYYLTVDDHNDLYRIIELYIDEAITDTDIIDNIIVLNAIKNDLTIDNNNSQISMTELASTTERTLATQQPDSYLSDLSFFNQNLMLFTEQPAPTEYPHLLNDMNQDESAKRRKY